MPGPRTCPFPDLAYTWAASCPPDGGQQHDESKPSSVDPEGPTLEVSALVRPTATAVSQACGQGCGHVGSCGPLSTSRAFPSPTLTRKTTAYRGATSSTRPRSDVEGRSVHMPTAAISVVR
jgi:hypothetical protein